MATTIYGEVGAGITCRILNKTGLTKGYQTVLISDVHCVRLSEYRYRENLHVKPPGWNVRVNTKAKEIMEVMKLMVEGEEGEERQILCEHPHSTWEITSVGIR